MAEDEEDAASNASEWEARDQAERAWERREEEERLGRSREGDRLFFLSFSLSLNFLISFVFTSLARKGMRGAEEATT